MKTTASACLIAALVIFTSCHERNFFCDDAKLVEKFPMEVSLTATPFMENVYGYDGMISTGNKIVLLSNKLSHIFYVYDMNGVLSGEFGTIGRGPGEMLGCRETGQGLLFNDVNNRRLVSVDLEASLARGALVQNASYETLPMSSNCYLGRDSVLFIEQMTDSNFHMISYDMKTGERRSETLYSEDVDNPYAYYQSTWRKHPERDILVGGMWWLNQINIISMEDGSRKSLMIGKRPPVYNDAVSTGGLPVHSKKSL